MQRVQKKARNGLAGIKRRQLLPSPGVNHRCTGPDLEEGQRARDAKSSDEAGLCDQGSQIAVPQVSAWLPLPALLWLQQQPRAPDSPSLQLPLLAPLGQCGEVQLSAPGSLSGAR